MYLNRLQEERARRSGLVTAHLAPQGPLKGGASMAPHASFWTWPGQLLLGCRRDAARKSEVINGCTYKVAQLTPELVGVQLHLEAHFEAPTPLIWLSHHDAVQLLRLACARTYSGCQGLTLRDSRLLLLYLKHQWMCARKLYVGISRVTSGDLLHIPSNGQVARINMWLKQ